MQTREFRDFIERVKLRSPIEGIVAERVPELQRRGSAYKACCPFHQERTPSFVVNPERGTWRCFGACNEGGDVISFLQRFEGLSFHEALRVLAAACGETLPELTGRRVTDAEERERAQGFEALQRAERFYARQLFLEEGAAALAYARGRGLTDETLKAFGVGYAPRRGSPLCEGARKVRFEEEALLWTGLARRSADGRVSDFFYARLMIPIRDAVGRTVGFGGRKLPEDMEPGGKYINTPETPLFKKSRLIYGFDRAQSAVRSTKHLILMEGYTDVMAAHQVGISRAAAVLGTATTEDHAAWVRRSGARRVTLVFDGDEAGLKAGLRALEQLLPLGLDLDVVRLPEGQDPCDLCIARGAPGFEEFLSGARDWFEHALELLAGLTGARLSEGVDELLRLLRHLRPVDRDLRVKAMAAALGVSEEGIRAQARELVPHQRPSRPAAPSPAPPRAPAAAAQDGRLVRCFEGLLGALVLDNSLIPSVRPRRPHCPAGPLERIFDAVLELWDEGDDEAPIDEAALLNALADDSARDLVVSLAGRAATAESPSVLVRDELAWLARRDREREVQERFADLKATPDLDDAPTQETLRRLHSDLRGIKVPKSSPNQTLPQHR